MTVQNKTNLTLAKLFTEENDMSKHDHDFVMEGQIAGGNSDFRRTIFHETTDLDAANEAANRAAAYGFEHQIWFAERQGLPSAGVAFVVALDELLLDAHGRRKYHTWLLKLKLPIPLVVISRDFLFDVPIVIRPGVMLAPRLDENLMRAIRSGHFNLHSDAGGNSSTEEGAKRKSA